MAVFEAAGNNPLGLHPGKAERVRVKIQGSSGNRGQVVYFDLATASTSGVTASTAFGGATDPTSNVRLATASHDGGQTGSVIWLHGILAEDIAAGAEGWCYIRGIVQALGGATIAAGVGLNPVAGSEMGAAMVNSRITGISLEALTDATLGWIAFNGIEGFGTAGAATA
jgi:hypothetical protein